MTIQRVMRPWSNVAIAHLLDRTSCPACEVDALVDRHCRNCGVQLTDDLAEELWTASKAAADALEIRQTVLDRLPHVPPAVTSPLPHLGTAPSTANPQRMGGRAVAGSGAQNGATPQTSATVQSVLAVAGAGLFAISALVFTFFNPDLTDRAARSVIVGVTTILFLGGAWLLARRRLQFSAEAVGGLGMLFVALDVYAFSELAPTGVSAWAFAAIGTLSSGIVMVIGSTLARIRSWLWISLSAITVVPAMLGYASGTALSGTLGHLGVAFVAIVVLIWTPHLAQRFDANLRSERLAVGSLQLSATGVALVQMWFITSPTPSLYWLTMTSVLVAVAALGVLAARQLAKNFWYTVAGAAGVGSGVVFPFVFDLMSRGAEAWYLSLLPAAGAIALLILDTVVSRSRSIERRAFLNGALVAVGVSVLSPVLLAVAIGAETVLSALPGQITSSVLASDWVLAVVLGLSAMSVGLGVFSLLSTRRAVARENALRADTASSSPPRGIRSVAVWLAALAGLTFACLPTVTLWGRIAIALGMVVAVSLVLTTISRARNSSFSIRIPLIVGSLFAVLLAMVYSWADDDVTVWAGIAIVAAIGAAAQTVSPRIRFLHVGAGYAYALIIFGTALEQLGFDTIALLCLVTSLASIGAIVATFLRWVGPGAWYSILLVTSVPFLIGVLQVVFERSGWTALSTALTFLLALTLLVTRRAGLGLVLRSTAAGLLVPSLSVVVVCLGAQVLLGSASPATLPVIATIVALVMPSTGMVTSILQRRGIASRDAAAARIAIEASTLLTGAIAVALALLRDAAGLPTTFIVLVIIGVGAAATSLWGERRYGWWVAGAAFTGAVWSLWALIGIDVLEPYLLPPSLAAATVGFVLTARGQRAVPLYSTGLVMAVGPILVVLAAVGTGTTAVAPWRGYGLVAASWLLLGLGLLLGRGSSARAEFLRPLRAPTLSLAIAAGAAGAVQGVRFGVGTDSIVTGSVPVIVICFGIGLAGALPAALSSRSLHIRAAATSRLAFSRWLYAPAVVYVAVATWTAIERDWFTIWAMWTLMLAYLLAVVVTAWRLRAGSTSLPPVWFVFGIAFVTAIVAWSPRDLRVEWFSLPLGLFLLAAGALFIRARSTGPDNAPRSPGTFNSWPARWNGSWPLLSPGIVTMLSASIIATFTDPLTWRAILVIVIALIAILIGSSLKLGAPFMIGIIVLPIENILVFLVQIGRGIESMPWWITLAVVGAVLLIIAVTYERRAGEANSITDRLRDLR